MVKNRAIVFIHKDKFELYDEIQSKIFQFVFQPTVFQDLELVDIDELKNQIKTFVTTNKLTVSNMLYVISDLIVFEKIYTAVPAASKNLEIQKFLESIPFEHVSYKLIDSPQNFKVLAINKELYSSLQLSFDSLGFNSLGVIPQSSLGNQYRSSQTLNIDIVKYILLHFDILQKQSFVQEEVKSETQSNDSENPVTESPSGQPSQSQLNKYRLPALISVFVLLIGVLSFVVYKQYTPKSKASPVPPIAVPPTIAVPSPPIQESPIGSPPAKPI